MQWTSRGLLLPVLCGISVTFSATVLYFLYKKNKRDIPKKVCLQGIISKYHIPQMVKCEKLIRKLQEETNTELTIHNHKNANNEYLYTIKGDEKNAAMANSLISSIINIQPNIETKEISVSHKTCKKILGRHGETLNDIQENSKAHIDIKEDSSESAQFSNKQLTMEGTNTQIKEAHIQIKELMEKVKVAKALIQANKINLKLPHCSYDDFGSQEKMFCTLSLNTPLEVYVCAMQTPNRFWIQINNKNDLHNLTQELGLKQYYLNANNHISEKMLPGKLIAVNDVNQWYRGEIITVLDNSQYEIYYLDFGEYHIIPEDQIYKLEDDTYTMKFQAIECSLADVKPRENEWSSEACARFAEVTSMSQWKPMIAMARHYEEHIIDYGSIYDNKLMIPYIDLYDKNDKDINIGLDLVHSGFAEIQKEDDSPPPNSTLLLCPCDVPCPLYKTSDLLFTEDTKNHNGEIFDLVIKEVELTSEKNGTENKNIDYTQKNKNQDTTLFSNKSDIMDVMFNLGQYLPAGYESDSENTDEFEMS